MIVIDVNIPIAPESENRWMAQIGGENSFFSLETLKRIFAENPDEKDFKFNFACDGGYVDEGFAIYDFLRTSGKNIYCNIESGCHSMAIVMLLAAPKAHRTANRHATSLIHCVRAEYAGDMTAEDLRSAANELEQAQEKILDIYATRTGIDKRILRNLMKEEKVRDADFLLKFGFIGRINSYNTNRKNAGSLHMFHKKIKSTDMAKNEVLSAANAFVKSVKNMLGMAANYDFADADGNVIFSTEAEDETLEVGMAAAPDGTFELPDGRTVVIAEGAIVEIQEPETEEEAVAEEPAEVPAESEEVENLKNQLREALNVIESLKAEMKSNYKPVNAKRTSSVATTNVSEKDKMRERLGIKKA